MVAEAELRNLGRELRALAESTPSSKADLSAWYERARVLERDLKAAPSLCDQVPHFVWHYLADADVRARDESYRANQQAKILEIILALERGALSPNAT